MPLFSFANNKLVPINEKKVSLERDVQKITENNLDVIFGYKFIAHELELDNLRIDTLSFNPETNSFVIIEYKKDQNFHVIDQGFAYLDLVLRRKAEFILEYNETQKNNLKRDEVDWSQTRVVFISPQFTTYQRRALNFRDVPMELWEVKTYDNGTYLYNEIKAAEKGESIKMISKSATIEKVSREVKNYSVDDHFKSNWTESRAIFDEIRPQIMGVDSRLEESPQKYYIGYKIDNSLAFVIKAYKSGIQLEFPRIEPKDVKDPDKEVKYVKDSMKFYNKHVSYYWITDAKQIDYAIFLAKQVHEKLFK